MFEFCGGAVGVRLVDPFRVESVEEQLVRGRCPRLRLDEPFGLQ